MTAKSDDESKGARPRPPPPVMPRRGGAKEAAARPPAPPATAADRAVPTPPAPNPAASEPATPASPPASRAPPPLPTSPPPKARAAPDVAERTPSPSEAEPRRPPSRAAGPAVRVAAGLLLGSLALLGGAVWWVEGKLQLPSVPSQPAAKPVAARGPTVVGGAAGEALPAPTQERKSVTEPQVAPDSKAPPEAKSIMAEPALRLAQASSHAQTRPDVPSEPRQVRPMLKPPPQTSVVAGATAPFLISIEPPALAAGAGTVRVDGLPAGLTFSRGRAETASRWRVPVADLAGLAIAAAIDMADGRHPLALDLRSAEDVGLALAEAIVVIEAAARPPAMSDPARASEATTRQWLADGRRLLATGNVAAARLVLQRAAEHGLGEAALVLGDTYDPAKLYAMGVLGMPGDIAKAVQWYEKADELGEPQAKGRLIAIGTP